MPARVKPHEKTEGKPQKVTKSLTGLLHHHRSLQNEMEEAARAERAKSEAPPFKNRALYCLSPENKFRRKIIGIVYSKKFTAFIILCIMLNCIFLAIGNPACQKLTSASAVRKAVDEGFKRWKNPLRALLQRLFRKRPSSLGFMHQNIGWVIYGNSCRPGESGC